MIMIIVIERKEPRLARVDMLLSSGCLPLPPSEPESQRSTHMWLGLLQYICSQKARE